MRLGRRARDGFALLIATLATLAAGSTTAVARTPPVPDADEFVKHVDNPYFPLPPGARWVYENRTPDGLERIVVEVTGATKEVLGITTTVVHDTVALDGEVIEDTYDWFAQDRAGNVWYFGEDTHELENGVPVNAKGAWEAGVDGARPGIMMEAHPRVGDRYAQEQYPGVAQDRAKVVSVTASANVPFGRFSGDVLKTRDWNPLEPKTDEHKFYAKGIGTVLERSIFGADERVELVEHTKP